MLSFYFLLKLIRRTQVCNFPRVFTNKTAAEDELVLHSDKGVDLNVKHRCTFKT